MDFIEFHLYYLLAKRILPAGVTDLIFKELFGIGGILIFIPQIAFLFLFISILKSGYMSRSFLMDKIMRKFGLSGKVVPLIPGTALRYPSYYGN
jgi:ferrous iron transport protein B